MAAAASSSLAAATVLMHRLPLTNRAAVFLPLAVRPSLCSTTFKKLKEKGRSSQRMVKASSSEESSLDANELFTSLKEKVIMIKSGTIYGGGAVVGLWLASIVVSVVNSVPLLPKVMELVGLGYTGWFVYRYLLFKSNRKELETDMEELKKKISGAE